MTDAITIPPPLSMNARTLTALPTPRPRHMRHWAVGGLLVVGVGLAATAAAAIHRSKDAVTAGSTTLPRVDGKRIVFSEQYAKRIALESIAIGRNAVVPAFSVVGTVTFDPTHVARVGARLRGVVRDVSHFEGTNVRAGEALASLDSPELGQAQASVSMLGAENHAAQLYRAREQGLAERQLTTIRDVEESSAAAERSKALLAAAQQRVTALDGRKSDVGTPGLGVHVLSSPLSGTIIERHVMKGQLIDANYVAFLVANLDHLWVELSVSERILPSIKVGDLVELRANSSGSDAVVNGEVAQVGAILHADTRNASVRVRVDNRERKFRAGQSVAAVIRATAAAVENVPTVPSSAVIYVDGQPSVFVADSPTSVIVTAVQLGETNGQEVHVKTGVISGQRVVVQGTLELRNQLFR